MDNEIKIWNYETSEIRTLEINNEPWFVGKDVAEVLGYANASKAVSAHVDSDDKQFIMMGIADSQNGNLPIGQSKTAIINESGLYSLILSSKLPDAKKFKKWVTSEVLPSIRKHGLYAIDEMLENPDIMIEALIKLKEEREKTKALKQTIAIQGQQITELQPKASYYDKVLQCKDLVPISVIAKDYGWTAVHMNQFLHDKGIQYKQGNKIWLLYKSMQKWVLHLQKRILTQMEMD